MGSQQTTQPAWIEVSDFSHPAGWADAARAAERARQCCEQLERGEILLLRGIPFEFPQSDLDYLARHRAEDSRFHKNISYRPGEDLLRGFGGDAQSEQRVHAIMRNYSRAVTEFVARLLAPYAGRWTLDYASFRPLEEAGRPLSLHKRNDLLHVDAFPSRPTHGARILRVFTNISPEKNRVWLAGMRFTQLADQYARRAGIEDFAHSTGSLAGRTRHVLHALGLPIADRSAYDSFMLHFHDWMKENSEFQAKAPRQRIEFPPFTTWLVFTDTVPHAVLSGQFALEQTYIVAVEAMVTPEVAPIRVLEKISGAKLA